MKNINMPSEELVLFVLEAAIKKRKNMLIQRAGTREHCFNESAIRNNELATSSELSDPDSLTA